MRVHYDARDSFISAVMVFCNFIANSSTGIANNNHNYVFTEHSFHCIVATLNRAGTWPGSNSKTNKTLLLS